MNHLRKDISIIKDAPKVLEPLGVGCAGAEICYHGDAALNTDPLVDVITDRDSNRRALAPLENRGSSHTQLLAATSD